MHSVAAYLSLSGSITLSLSERIDCRQHEYRIADLTPVYRRKERQAAEEAAWK